MVSLVFSPLTPARFSTGRAASGPLALRCNCRSSLADGTAPNLLPPALGFLICFLLWISLSRTAQIAGSIWMLAGIAFGAWKTRGFRAELVNFDIPSDNEP